MRQIADGSPSPTAGDFSVLNDSRPYLAIGVRGYIVYMPVSPGDGCLLRHSATGSSPASGTEIMVSAIHLVCGVPEDTLPVHLFNIHASVSTPPLLAVRWHCATV